ncbi:MAG: protein-L-isoaspartate O-methyltransferase family protein [Sphingorhabdus sp.]
MQSSQSETARKHMIDSQLRTSGITTSWIIGAFMRVARENFLPVDKAAFAYQDRSIALCEGRYLNPPLATAQLLQTARISTNDSILIVGSATGYMAALIAGRARRIVALESNRTLAEIGRANVPEVEHVTASLADGAPDAAPYTLILIDGAIQHLPTAIEAQLAEGGRVVTGLAEGEVRRLAIGIKHEGHLVLRPFADLEIAPLPGFERAREFMF